MKFNLKDLLLLAAVVLGILSNINWLNVPFWIYIILGLSYFGLRYFDEEIKI
jgi:hypothetical protein